MALQGCGDNHYYCGEGTQAVDGQCVDIGTECGPGTHDEDGECVLDDDVVICGDGTEEVDGECVPVTETGLPPVLDAVTSPTPYPSGGLMILEGDNFDLTDSGPMVVTVDGVATTNVMVLSNNVAIADLPASTIAVVEVEISNDLGDDAMDFSYTGLFAAQGGGFGGSIIVNPKAFGPLPPPPELHILDPRTGAHAVVGPILSDAGTVPRLLTSLAFDDAGTLWGVEAVFAGDFGTDEAALFTIDRNTGAATEVATVTVVDDTPPLAFGPPPPVLAGASFPDIVWSGTTLFATSGITGHLVTIDTTSGDTTKLGPVAIADGMSLTALDDGNLLFGDDTSLVTIESDDAAFVGTSSFSANPNGYSALTWLDGVLYGTGSGGTGGLYRFDFANGEAVPMGPALLSYDALATPPELDGTPGTGPAFDVVLARPELDSAVLDADDVFAPVAAKVSVNPRGRRGVALADVVGGDGVTLRSATDSITLAREELAAYRLVENKRGNLKLVGADGRAVLKRITQIEEN